MIPRRSIYTPFVSMLYPVAKTILVPRFARQRNTRDNHLMLFRARQTMVQRSNGWYCTVGTRVRKEKDLTDTVFAPDHYCKAASSPKCGVIWSKSELE